MSKKKENAKLIFKELLVNSPKLAAVVLLVLTIQSNSELGTLKDLGPIKNTVLWVLLLLVISYLIERYELIFPIKNDFQTTKNTIKGNTEKLETLLNDHLNEHKNTNIFSEYINLWKGWKYEILRNENKFAKEGEFAIDVLTKSHLSLELDSLKDGKIKNTSENYTTLITKINNYLYDKHISPNSNKRLVRYHITGMLPEEHFNGPQIEYTTNNSTPIIFCHKFESEVHDNNHYAINDKKKLMKRLDINRCIVVRNGEHDTKSEYSALSTLSDLKKQKELVISKSGERPIASIRNDSKIDVLERLYAHCISRVDLFVNTKSQSREQYLAKIINYNSYNYFPIATRSQKTSMISDFVDLITYFSTYFSGGMKDVFYYDLNINNQSKINKINAAGKYFKEGAMPEILLFGIKTSNRKNSKIEWVVGLKGLYQQYSKEMEIEILNSFETSLSADELLPELFKLNISQL